MRHALRNMFPDENKKDVFVTGAHRSGSSWIGKMLALGENICLRDEEIFHRYWELAKAPFEKMHAYICQENEHHYLPYVNRMVNNRFHLARAMAHIRSARDVGRVVKRQGVFWRRQLQSAERTIYIEPIGLFSAEWFSQKFHTDMLLVIRHPASFVSSLKSLNWGYNFNDLLEQPLLMDRYLSRFRHDMERAPRKPDVVGIGILLWKILYSVVHQYQQQHPDWIFIRHEDYAQHPEKKFQELYQRLHFPFTTTVEQTISDYTSPSNPTEFSGKRDYSRRNSRETIHIWKTRLTEEEVKRIRDGVEEVSSFFYDGASWE